MRRSRLLAPLCLLVLLGACGGDAGAGDDGGAQAAADPVAAEDGAVAITGTDRLRWQPEEVTADAGELTIELTCEAAVNHNLEVAGEQIAECTPGGTDTGTVSLEAGEHEFVCTVPGHDRTMRGTITVS